MGSNSRSTSSQTTNNTSTTFGIQGDNLGKVLNGDGNHIIDGGAFDIVGRLVDALPMLFTSGMDSVSDGFGTVEELATLGVGQNMEFLDAGLKLFEGASEAGQNALAVAGSSLADGYELYAKAGQQNLESALEFGSDALKENTNLAGIVSKALEGSAENMAELASEAMMENADLSATSIEAVEKAHANNAKLAERAISSAENVTSDSQKLLTSGFNDMLGLMERFSRSDGAALADGNNKTILMLFGGVSITVILVALIATRSKK